MPQTRASISSGRPSSAAEHDALLTAALAAFKPTLIYVDSCLPHSPKVEKYCEELAAVW